MAGDSFELSRRIKSIAAPSDLSAEAVGRRRIFDAVGGGRIIFPRNAMPSYRTIGS
jgi:hypothetical protein